MSLTLKEFIILNWKFDNNEILKTKYKISETHHFKIRLIKNFIFETDRASQGLTLFELFNDSPNILKVFGILSLMKIPNYVLQLSKRNWVCMLRYTIKQIIMGAETTCRLQRLLNSFTILFLINSRFQLLF